SVSSTTSPAGVRTTRSSASLPPCSRQPTHVRAGSCLFLAGGLIVPRGGAPPRPAFHVAGCLCLTVLGAGGLDVDPPPGQLRGEARVLSVAADRERQLIPRHPDVRGSRVRIDRDAD